jgi:hypothetical protein
MNNELSPCDAFRFQQQLCSIILVVSILGYIYPYSCRSHLEQRASVKRFFSLQFLNFRQSVGLFGQMIRPSQGRYLHAHRKNSNIHALSEIRTHDPSVRVSGHCDRHEGI